MNNNPNIEKPTSDPQTMVGTAATYISKFNPFTIHKRGQRAKALFALSLVCFFWGTTWIASKEAVRHLHPLHMAGIRQFLGGCCYVIFFLAKGATWPKGKEWITILILSFLNFMLSNALSTWGVKYISAGLGSLIGAMFPLWLVIINMAGSKTHVPRKTVFGLLLGFTGICVIFYEHLIDFANPEFRLGIFLSLASTWSWAFGTLYTKQQAVNFNPYFSLGLQMVISGVTLFGISHATNNAISLQLITWQAWAAIGYLVLFGSVISFIAYLYALQNLPTEQASLYAYINPIVAILLGWMIFSEKLNAYIITGTLISLYGVYLVNKEARRMLTQKK